MGKVLSYGVDLIATGRTTRLDKQFDKDIVDLVAEMEANPDKVTPREALHVTAIKQFADGCVWDCFAFATV